MIRAAYKFIRNERRTKPAYYQYQMQPHRTVEHLRVQQPMKPIQLAIRQTLQSMVHRQ